MSDHAQTAIEASAAVTSGAAKTSFVAGGGALAGKWLGLDPVTALGLIVGLGGLFVSFLSFLINWYYKSKANQRANELHQLALRKGNGECNVE